MNEPKRQLYSGTDFQSLVSEAERSYLQNSKHIKSQERNFKSHMEAWGSVQKTSAPHTGKTSGPLEAEHNHLFIQAYFVFSFCFFFVQRKIIYLEKKLHTSTSLTKSVLSDRKKVAVWKKIYTHCLQKRRSFLSNWLVKVLKIKADLWRIKKITLLNIKPYNLCKNSMWPTKAYIYLYIVHLKHIYNLYSQTKGGKKLQTRHHV